MFTNHIVKTIKPPSQPFNLPSGYHSVLPAEELLQQKAILKPVSELRKILKLPMIFQDYDAFCDEVISTFSTFVQKLPETKNSFYRHDQGILLHAIERSIIVSNLCRAYFIDPETPAQITELHALWMFILFTAALFHRIGHQILQLEVKIIDPYSGKKRFWEAFQGSMLHQATAYNYKFKEVINDTLFSKATVLFARQLLPAEAFCWIARDDDTLAAWLALLEEDWTKVGSMSHLIPIAQIESLYKQFLLEADAAAPDYFVRRTREMWHAAEFIDTSEESTITDDLDLEGTDEDTDEAKNKKDDEEAQKQLENKELKSLFEKFKNGKLDGALAMIFLKWLQKDTHQKVMSGKGDNAFAKYVETENNQKRVLVTTAAIEHFVKTHHIGSVAQITQQLVNLGFANQLSSQAVLFNSLSHTSQYAHGLVFINPNAAFGPFNDPRYISKLPIMIDVRLLDPVGYAKANPPIQPPPPAEPTQFSQNINQPPPKPTSGAPT